MSIPRRNTVLPICGSLRSESHNAKLLAAAASSAPAGLSFRQPFAIDGLPYFNEDLEQRPLAEDVRDFCRSVHTADGLLFATPEYNQSIPGVLKNAIDWLSRSSPEVLIGKPVCVIGATVGPWGTRLAQTSLRQLLYTTGALVLPPPGLFVAKIHESVDNNGAIDAKIVTVLSRLMSSFDSWIELTGNITKWMKDAELLRA